MYLFIEVKKLEYLLKLYVNKEYNENLRYIYLEIWY